MAIFENSLFTNDDFLQIENVLYTPREEEMVARTLLRLNTSYASYAEEIGYDYYQREGSAKILAKGGGSKDIPFVNEKGGRVTQRVYDIVTGIRWTIAEQEAIAAKRALGKGPSVQLDTLRVESARRFIMEKENKLTFVGDTEYGIKGLFDSSFYGANLGTSENVATTGTGSTDANKRLWANKTPQNILKDLRSGMETVENDGLFKARSLILSPKAYNQLRQPYSDENVMTVLDWINTNGMYFENIFTSRVMQATNNGDTVDYFMVLDTDPEVVELAIVDDIKLLDPVYDIVRTMEQAVVESYGGVLFRHPAGAYIGKGI
jgi:hypothetical protein